MILAILVLLIAGVFNGLSDRSKFHPSTLPENLQGRCWWSTGDIPSWKLKYKDNDPEKGAKFFLSTTALVFLTDSHHFFKASGQTLFAFGLSHLMINYDFIYPLEVFPFLWVAALVIYKAGFHLSYR